MRYREAKPEELERVLQVHALAFSRQDESLLVAKLLQDETALPVLSCVAEEDGAVIGHALFTALGLVGTKVPVECAILAPLAVLPGRRNAGVGRNLIEYGCRELRRRRTRLLFVLGDPGYYTRCGFQPAIPHGLRAPYTITPEEAWMVRPLGPHILGTVEGTVVCARSLQPEPYWRE
ncbi:GNAT family N-acetyltransferase [Candidatus Thiodictyon syntrophicum]|uniref:N-acetyltransferase domain-containing protein n=1 Tax=Candidatus Thiodictyon syntrophicum TaxID=1166950 RepID=A0A2K8U9P3_9GAMM|nr:N-acetyltransferase [Candidatus Thiodictyon syntrophicum]AUB82257.1 hypothetical protein THSYN_15745 [Candidatus Thiodictyon syntrophicum]